MSNHLEQFIRNHREEFDTEEPSDRVWENIRPGLEPHKKQGTAVVLQLKFLRRSIAAAIIVLAAGGAWYYFSHTGHSDAKPVAITEKPPVDTASQKHALPQVTDSPSTQLAQENTRPKNETNKEEKGVTEEESNFTEEMYHYARLVEIKHNELKKIEKDEPLLYRQFAGDVHKLDSVYRSLERQLPKNPNREQLLEAMIQNLQLQMGLLNRQLEIIKQINHTKKSEYEKAYKSV
jgi:hypothetical protein